MLAASSATSLASALLPTVALSTLPARLATDAARLVTFPVNATSKPRSTESLRLLLLQMMSLLLPSRHPMLLPPSFLPLSLFEWIWARFAVPYKDLWTWCRYDRSYCLHNRPCSHFFFSFWSTIFRSSVLVSAFPTHTRHLLQPAFVLPFLYHLDFLGAALLSRPINDLRKVLSRDPDRDVHHFLFSPTQTTSICKSITRRKALEESKRRREKGDIEHAAERERRDDGREEG